MDFFILNGFKTLTHARDQRHSEELDRQIWRGTAKFRQLLVAEQSCRKMTQNPRHDLTNPGCDLKEK